MKAVKKISSLSLALLVLFSSMIFTFNVHLCMGQIETMSLIKAAKPCAMAAESFSCEEEKQNHHSNTLTHNGCCEDHSLYIEGQEELLKINPVSVPDLQFIAVLYLFTSYLYAQPFAGANFFKEYLPPFIERDIPVLVQSFLL